MSAVREETAVITHEVAAVAKTEAIQSVKAAEGEVLNPLAVRQAVKATVQESATKRKRTLPYLIVHRQCCACRTHDTL